MRSLIRFSTVGLCLLLAIALAWRSGRDDRRRTALLEEIAPLLSPEGRLEASGHLSREPDVAHAKALNARLLVAETLRRLGDPSLAPRLKEHGERLAAARRLAAEALRDSPHDWTAAMMLGTATYLERSLARDRRLFTEAPAWEGPLLRATELAPNQPEPRRFLGMAYLEIWNILPENKQLQALTLIASSLEDPATFERLIRPWLATAPDLTAAMTIVPDRPFAWLRLRQIFAEAFRWEAFAEVTERWHRSVGHDLTASREEAERRLRLGDAAGARNRILEALRLAPVDGLFAEAFADLVELLPPGPVDRAAAETFRAWLRWGLEPCSTAACPLPPATYSRLLSLAQPLEPAVEAATAEAAGDRIRGEAVERRSEGTATAAWGPYHLLRARRLHDEGQEVEARQALSRVDPTWGDSLAYQQIQHALSPSPERAAPRRGAAWNAGDWRVDSEKAIAGAGHRAVLELQAERPAPGVEIELGGVHRRGSAIEIRWDGTTLATHAALAAGPVTVRVPVTPGPHRLEIESVAGPAVTPGAVTLLPAGS